MARPQSADFDKRKDAIISIAARLFAKRGFLGTSMSDLAEACATSKSLVYHYFGGKEDILVAVMSRHLDDLLAIPHDATAPAEERLRSLTRAFMACYVEAADFQKVLLNELDNLPPSARENVVLRQRELISRVESDVTELLPTRDKAELRAQTMLFFGMINWAHTWYHPTGSVSPDRLADMAVDILIGRRSSTDQNR
jgi:AcrR family transcriptional regulator